MDLMRMSDNADNLGGYEMGSMPDFLHENPPQVGKIIEITEPPIEEINFDPEDFTMYEQVAASDNRLIVEAETPEPDLLSLEYFKDQLGLIEWRLESIQDSLNFLLDAERNRPWKRFRRWLQKLFT